MDRSTLHRFPEPPRRGRPRQLPRLRRFAGPRASPRPDQAWDQVWFTDGFRSGAGSVEWPPRTSFMRAGRAGKVDVRMKTVFTTGEAAKICKVSQQTIIRCFDNGQLKGFRVPGSKFRRIPREALYKFMKDNSIPTDALESGKRKVLLVDDDPDLVEMMHKALQEDGRFEVRIASNGFDAGMMVKEYRPDLIILDVMLPDINGKEVCHRVRADTGWRTSGSSASPAWSRTTRSRS